MYEVLIGMCKTVENTYQTVLMRFGMYEVFIGMFKTVENTYQTVCMGFGMCFYFTLSIFM